MVNGLLPEAPDVHWLWWWVPSDGEPAEALAQWQTSTAGLFTQWLGDGITAVIPTLPAELRDEITPESVAHDVASWLRGRAAGLPTWTRIAWGAGFLDPERPRWVPVVVVVEMREPAAEDAGYLLDELAPDGAPDDARRPVVDYVTTTAGDGVRVAALVRGPDGEAYARVDAALRVDATDAHGPVDVRLSTRVVEQSLFGVVGQGVAELMHLVAAEVGPGAAAAPGGAGSSVRGMS